MNRTRTLALFVVAAVVGWLFGTMASREPAAEPEKATASQAAPDPGHAATDVSSRAPAREPVAEEAGGEAPAELATRTDEEPAALRTRARSLLATGQLLEGVQLLEKAVELDPTADAHGELGRLLRHASAVDRSLYHLRRAAELEPDDADRWIELADAYYRKPDPGAAWAAEREAKRLEPALALDRSAGGVRRRDDSANARD